MLSAFDDGRLFGAVYGAGPPWALALHGWGRDHRDFDRVLGAADGADGALDAIALDLPGFGASPAPPETWGSGEYARALAPVLTSMSGPAVVLGHSLGGRVAVHVAASFPDHVAALVLTGAPLFRRAGTAPKPRLRYRMVRRLARTGLVSEARMEKGRQRHGSADYRAAQGVMRSVLVKMLQEDYAPQLRAVRCPVELVWGDDDTAAPLEVAERVRAEIPAAQLTVCHGAGHLTPLTVPAAIRAAVERHRP